MALSGYKTPKAARLSVKRTHSQRVTAARRRRAWVDTERSADKGQNGCGGVRMTGAEPCKLLKSLVNPGGVEPPTL